MDPILLARWQFALTIGFHFIFVPISIGLAWMLVIFETLGWRKRDEDYLQLGKLFGKLLAITFAVGVATGIVMEFQFGTNWGEYSKFVGDIFGAPLAYVLEAGFVPIRKPGKLPSDVYEARYELEYGSDTLAVHQDAIAPGERALIVDDLLATGGTISAAVDLVRQLGGVIVGVVFLIELTALKGRAKLDGHHVLSLISY